jgi:hypothetical protein
MKLNLYHARWLLWLAVFLCGCGEISAQTVLTDGFESGSFSNAWGLTSGVVITNSGGANGRARFAKLAAYTASTGRELGARFDGVAPGGAKDFAVEFSFRVQSTTNRQLHLHVSTSTGVIGSSAPALSVRYQSGWAAYDGASWQTLAGLNTVATNQWYRLRVTGQDWGTATAQFALQLSDAGATNFTSSASNIVWFQGGTPTANTAKFFVFTTVYGNDPGFDVDEVSAAVTATPATVTNAVVNISGVYPHLAVFSPDGEIGIGAVMPWAGKLWLVTYPPHAPSGSSDKLWMLDTNLTLTAHPSSVGCTDANRLVHRESQQLNIGHYLIDTNANVRVIAPATMPGRLTASARHLFDPTNKIYIATMEEGLYEVNINTLAVTELYHDMNTTPGTGQIASGLPGTHGKGLYSSQGKLFYSNNGSGGSLSQWNGTNWTVIETNKFTELTGPGGVYGNDAGDDRLWSLGWDTRSVILRLLQNGAWTRFRLPKASYTHDADHGWFTEWPRIREITDGKMLMHMHGMFYYFPKTFSVTNTGGITPISTFLKMPVDYCWWNGRIVMGRDDATTTGQTAPVWTGQSDSAPWFGQFSDLEKWGTPAGFGGVWLNDSVTANVPSEAFLVKNFSRRILHLKHTTAATVNFTLQHDATGFGAWTNLVTVSVTNNGYAYFIFPPNLDTTWVRLVADQNATGVTAYFHLQNSPQPPTPDLFAGLADANATNALSDGIIRSQEGDARTLQFAATLTDSNGAATPGYYEIDGALRLHRATNATAETTLRTTYSLSNADFTLDAASVIYTEGTNRFRLPRASSGYETAYASGWPRGVRELVTERNLFDADGTFYELPRSDSGGFRRVRPVTTHNKHISDFALWRGLLAIAGVSANAATNTHVYRSDDGQAALWFGDIDDLWRMGTPRGVGGPWKNSAVTNGVASDPYLMFGYERKVLELAHAGASPVTFTVELDFAADNSWSEYARFTVAPGQKLQHVFPDGFSAHWVRVKSDTTTTATAQFTYGPPAPQITGATWLSGGGFQITFTGASGQPYAVRSSSDLSLPLADWASQATGTFGAGAAVFQDLSATSETRRFYAISIP